MKISKVKISNFRGYKGQTGIDFVDFNAFIGKNDVGKSTILEALDIFFNDGKGAIKIDNGDFNVEAKKEGEKNIEISVIFKDFHEDILIDSTNKTSMSEEFLLNSQGELEIKKKYPNGGKEKVFIVANHPTNSDCAGLLLKKQKDLKKIIETKNIECEDKTKNAVMRKAIWENFKNTLDLNEIEIDVTKEDAKNIWIKLKEYLPLYTLFQSDRKNSDGDSEIQDPMKIAVNEILKDKDISLKLKEVAEEVTLKLQNVANETLCKLKEMNPEIANSLNPVMPPPDKLKWADVFKSVSISGDEDIPINKRGSGVRRLVLLNFFRAEAEKKSKENDSKIIYAIEEPETSQHPEHQQKLIDALITLSEDLNTQIILTTHSPAIVKMLKFEHLKLIKNREKKEIKNVDKNQLPYPSLNEVNFIAFNESDDGYHNELYGYIESEGLLQKYKSGMSTRTYSRQFKNGDPKEEQKILSEYIRHQIHHPENTHNVRYTQLELHNSIKCMRDFIRNNN